jgi:molybdopterin-biosynthesis enzyme MoeA-like protein
MRFGLVIVGDEILSGKRRDAHLPKVIELLAARGLSLAWARYVGDDRVLITEALRHAFASGDVVFSCGGIGATPDDHTRQCAAAALDRDLALHPQARALILERMTDVARERGEPYEPEREDVMKMVKENEVKFVDFRFTDTRGKEQHVTVPVSRLRRRQVRNGHAFDGSSIAGWKGIRRPTCC